MPHPAHFSALILAGGRSRRMGRDKALLPFRGERLLDRAVRFWRNAGAETVYLAAGSQAHLSALFPLPQGVQPVLDAVPGQGPMAGLVAAFNRCNADTLYISAVDMPLLSPALLPPDGPGDAAVYRVDGRIEPLFGRYRRSVLPPAQALLARGEGRMTALLDAVDTVYLDAAPRRAFQLRGVNTPEECRVLSTPVVSVVARSGTGKTTFLESLIPRLKARGLRVALLKHDGHTFQMDTPGKDTHRFAAAGADAVAIADASQCAIFLPRARAFTPEEIIPRLPEVDLVLTEGYHTLPYPKLELHRAAVPGALRSPEEELLAVLTDEALETAAPQLPLDDWDGCADLLCRYVADY